MTRAVQPAQALPGVGESDTFPSEDTVMRRCPYPVVAHLEPQLVGIAGRAH